MVVLAQAAHAASPVGGLGFAHQAKGLKPSLAPASWSHGCTASGRRPSLQHVQSLFACVQIWPRDGSGLASTFGVHSANQRNAGMIIKSRGVCVRAEASPVLKDKATASESEKKAVIEEAEKPDFKESFTDKKADPHWDSKDKSEAVNGISVGPDGYVAESGKDSASILVTTLPSEQGKVKKIRGQEVLAFDYGFQATFLSTGTSVPGNVIDLALTNFAREWKVRRSPIILDNG